MKKGFIVGKEVKSYTPQGATEVKISRTLHVVVDAREADDLNGMRVESIFCPFNIDDINVGDYCAFDYDVISARSGNYAKLIDVIVLGQAEVLLVAPETK